jgi:hypothetical protein
LVSPGDQSDTFVLHTVPLRGVRLSPDML